MVTENIEMFATEKFELLIENFNFVYDYEKRKFEQSCDDAVKDLDNKYFRIFIDKIFTTDNSSRNPQYEFNRCIYKIQIIRDPENISLHDFKALSFEFASKILNHCDIIYMTLYTQKGIFYKEFHK